MPRLGSCTVATCPSARLVTVPPLRVCTVVLPFGVDMPPLPGALLPNFCPPPAGVEIFPPGEVVPVWLVGAVVWDAGVAVCVDGVVVWVVVVTGWLVVAAGWVVVAAG